MAGNISSFLGPKSAIFLVMATALFLVAGGPASGLSQTPPAAPAAPSPGPRLDIVPTVFLVKDADAIKQIVQVILELPEAGPPEAAVRAWIGGKPADMGLTILPLKQGRNVFEARIPEVEKAVQARFEVRVGSGPGETTLEREIMMTPRRRWSIYLFHHSHSDIGYTELQSRVARNHVEYLDSVIKYCRETDAYPDDAKFRWNIEISWALENFVRTRPEADVKALADLIRAGRVELSALYLQVSDAFAHEEIVRTVDASIEFARRYGFEVRSAMNNDVNGFAWSLPQIFARAGVRYFASGINETRSRAPLRRPNPFWWESPDGSRILHWNGEHYLFGNYELLLHEPVDRSAPKVGDYLAKLEARGDYPYDIIAFNVGAWVTDNCPPGRGLSDRVKEWNERFVSPKLRLATMREFFERMEKSYGASLPVHKLGWPDYWTDGVASTAFETGLNRIAHNELISAEKVSALAARLDLGKAFRFPAGEIRDGHRSSMLYDEHTWGAWNSIDEPWSELARGQWATKSGFAYEARETSRTLLRRGADALAGLISSGGEHEFMVFNPVSWARTDAVRVTLPAGPLREAKGRLRVIDRVTGSEAKFQMSGEDAILVLAPNVPAMGYTVFAVEVEKPTDTASRQGSPAGETSGPAIENRYYRVTVDPKTGGIKSLFDKDLGLELVDASCPWPLNAYIYEQPEGGRKAVDDMTKRAAFKRWTSQEARIEAGESGAVTSSLVVRSSPKMCLSLEQRIVLYEDIKRIDLVDVLNKEETFAPEAVYFAFPFNVSDAPSAVKKGGSSPKGAVAPDVRFEIAAADMAPGKEQLPGTTLDWHTVQHWVEFSGEDARVVWSPVEAPLVQFGDINTGKWQKTLDLANAWVFSYAMNNYWMTNFKASQEGRVEFRYSLTSAPPAAPPQGTGPSSDRVASTRFGWDVHTPLVAAWLPAGNKGRFKAARESFLSVDKPNVIVQALWLDENGTPVARLREIAGEAVEARLASAVFLGFSTTTVGGHESVEIGSILVRLKPFEMQAVPLR
jgi:alpha-mannosidase